MSGDGDPVDVLIANQRGIVPGAVIAVRPIKDLEDRKWVKTLGWGDASAAKRMIVEGIARARAG